MNAKDVARRLEFIKYFTLKKSPIYLNVSANVDKEEQIKETTIHLSDDISFDIESLIVDYGESYNYNLKEKTITIFFNKKPIEGSIIGSGPDHEYEIMTNANGLMTPSIIQSYIIDGNSFRRYIFPSISEIGYYYNNYNEWYQTTLKDVDENYSRQSSMTILVPLASTAFFENFLNESLSAWKSRFNAAVVTAKGGDFEWLTLYDPKIYEYELDFEDRKSILNKLVDSFNWTDIVLDLVGYNKEIYKLFISLITNNSSADAKRFYQYMFEIDSSEETSKTNLQVYNDKLHAKLYDELIRTLMRFFYLTKEDVTEFMNNFSISRFYPIGLEMIGQWKIPLKTYYDLDEMHQNGTGQYTRGVKYGIETINGSNFKIKIKSAIQYKYNSYLKRVEYKVFELIGHNEEWNFDDILFVSPYLANEEIKGLNIPHGSVIPIPAFALPWLIDRNKSTEDIFDLIEKAVTFAGVVFPIIEIFEGVSILYNAIGIGFTLIGNTLGAGLADQIQRFDAHQSSILGHPYTKGQDFLGIYYLISAIYGGINLGKALNDAKDIKEKIKVFGEFETLWGVRSTVIDFNAFMEQQHGENIDSLNIIMNEMNLLDRDINRFQIYKEKK